MIFVPRKNIWTPSRSWPCRFGPKGQRGSTSVYPSVNAAQQGTAGLTAAFDEDVTVDNLSYCADGTSDIYDIFGYNVGNYDYHNTSSYGSITGTTYTDGISVSRTVAAVWYTENGSGSCSGDEFGISMQGTTVPDTDATFVEIEYENNSATLITYTRATATHTTGNGGSHWRWSGNLHTSGTRQCIIWL